MFAEGRWGGDNSNLDPICRDFCALVSYGTGQPVEIKVMDMCHECPKNHLDLSQTAFQQATGTTPATAGTLGKVYNATIKFQKCSEGPSGTASSAVQCYAPGKSAASVCPNSDWTGNGTAAAGNGTAGAASTGAVSTGSGSGSGSVVDPVKVVPEVVPLEEQRLVLLGWG